ncbi:MAG: dihydrodipicolinate reductase C-terminal domain-containing protein [Bacteroidales bacterium]
MRKIVLSGYGKMGQEIYSLLEGSADLKLYTSEEIGHFDPSIAIDSVCIDFTTPQAFKSNYRYIADHFRAAVVGTTGWDDIREEVVQYFKKSGKTLIWGSNFSVGVNLFFEISQAATELLSPTKEYDPYIIEYHHKFKLDAPSGTAASLRDIVEQRGGGKVAVESVRSGYIPGIHTLGFESQEDRITLTHEAFSRRGFATGAIRAASWALELEGVFNFRELLREKLVKSL